MNEPRALVHDVLMLTRHGCVCCFRSTFLLLPFVMFGFISLIRGLVVRVYMSAFLPLSDSDSTLFTLHLSCSFYFINNCQVQIQIRFYHTSALVLLNRVYSHASLLYR